MDYDFSTGAGLKAARVYLCVTQGEFAAEMKSHASYISHLERSVILPFKLKPRLQAAFNALHLRIYHALPPQQSAMNTVRNALAAFWLAEKDLIDVLTATGTTLVPETRLTRFLAERGPLEE